MRYLVGFLLLTALATAQSSTKLTLQQAIATALSITRGWRRRRKPGP